MTPPAEPDVGKLVVMVAVAALTAILTLAAVVTLPIGWVLAGSIVPVLLWAWLLREIHRLLRFRGTEPEHDAERDAERNARPWHRTAERRDEALAKIAPTIADLGEGALREELVVRVADRLQLGPGIVDRVVRAAPAPSVRPVQGSFGPRGGGQRGAPPALHGGGGGPWDDAGAYEDDPSQYEDAGRHGPPAGGGPARGGGRDGRGDRDDGPVRHAPRRLDPYDEQERTLLALMLALGRPGRDALASLLLDDLRVPHVRAVAEWLQAGGDEGGQLPADDRLAEVARDIVIRSGTLDARPAVLEVELAQLELRRLERQVGAARRSGLPVDDLLRSAHAIRERLDAAMANAMDL